MSDSDEFAVMSDPDFLAERKRYGKRWKLSTNGTG